MVTIRRFEERDQQSVKALISEIMEEEFRDEAEAYPTNDLETIRQAYGGLGEAFFIALNGNSVIGTVAIKKEDDRVALMRRLFVATDYRKKQVGKRLIDRACQFCEEVGYQEVIFKTTSKMEGAIQACQKQGFTQRAKIQLGQVELLKFSLSLRNGLKQAKSAS